jgi:hypothetical protein
MVSHFKSHPEDGEDVNIRCEVPKYLWYVCWDISGMPLCRIPNLRTPLTKVEVEAGDDKE